MSKQAKTTANFRQSAARTAKNVARPIAHRTVRLLIRRGKFVLKPIKRSYEAYLRNVPRLIYNTWAKQNENRCFVLDETEAQPLVSVVVPVFNPQYNHLLEMVYSVVNQHYPKWELLLVNGSTDTASRQQVAACAQIDVRVKVIDLPKNLGIAGNTNEGLAACSGKYVAFFDHDDLLHPCALHTVVNAITRTGADLIYTDEDKIRDDSSAFFAPLFKPKWSPDLLRNVNYFNHLTVVRRALVEKVGGLRAACNGAQDYDFLLRVIDLCKPKIQHIPRVLYHWRAASTSTASAFEVKSYVLESGTRALQEHIDRNGVKGEAHAIANRPGFYEIIHPAPSAISIVIGPVDQPNHRLCVAWLEHLLSDIGDKVKVELVIGDWFAAYRKRIAVKNVRLLPSAERKSYWQAAADAVTSKTVICFSSAALPANGDALLRLVAAASEDMVASPVIIGEDGTIVDAGLVEADHGKQYLFKGYKLGEDTYYGSTEWVRNVAGLTLDIFAASAPLFAKLAKHADDRLEDGMLHRALGESTRLVVYPGSTFVRKGALTLPSLVNEHYFNPQLTQAYPNIDVRVSQWKNLEQVSERASE